MAAGEWSRRGVPAPWRPAHRAGAGRQLGTRLHPRGGGVPGRHRSRQVLAAGGPDRPGVRRPQPGLRLPASGGLRRVTRPPAAARDAAGPRPVARGGGGGARRRRARLDRRGGRGRPGPAVPGRVDHQDDDRGRGAAAAGRGAARPRRPDRALRAGDRVRRRRPFGRCSRTPRACRASRSGPGGSGRPASASRAEAANDGSGAVAGPGSATTTPTSASRCWARRWPGCVAPAGGTSCGPAARAARHDPHDVPTRNRRAQGYSVAHFAAR